MFWVYSVRTVHCKAGQKKKKEARRWILSKKLCRLAGRAAMCHSGRIPHACPCSPVCRSISWRADRMFVPSHNYKICFKLTLRLVRAGAIRGLGERSGLYVQYVENLLVSFYLRHDTAEEVPLSHRPPHHLGICDCQDRLSSLSSCHPTFCLGLNFPYSTEEHPEINAVGFGVVGQKSASTQL